MLQIYRFDTLLITDITDMQLLTDLPPLYSKETKLFNMNLYMYQCTLYSK